MGVSAGETAEGGGAAGGGLHDKGAHVTEGVCGLWTSSICCVAGQWFLLRICPDFCTGDLPPISGITLVYIFLFLAAGLIISFHVHEKGDLSFF